MSIETADAVADQLEELEARMERIDARIIELVRQRAALAELVASARVDRGGNRFSHAADLAMVRRFGELGPRGKELAAILLRQAR